MIESSDLQAAIQRTQQAGRIQQLQNSQEEANRKRFELEMARERAEKEKRVRDAPRAEDKRVVRDKYDAEEPSKHRQDSAEPEDEKSPQDTEQTSEAGPDEDGGGHLDVRV